MTLIKNKANKEKLNTNEQKIQKEIEVFGVKLIKVVGVFGVILGMIIISAFWYWVITKLFKL